MLHYIKVQDILRIGSSFVIHRFEQNVLQFKKEHEITTGVVCQAVFLFSFPPSVCGSLGFE